MVSKVTVLALGLGTSIFALNAYAQQTSAPITDIRLSSGGLAEVRRQAEVKDNASVTLTVPLDQVDDVLKSLKVSDPKGNMSSASLASKQPLAEVFKNLPFSAKDLSSQSSLLDSLQGAAVTVSGDGREAKGRIVGVESMNIQGTDGETITRHRLTILVAGKLTSFDLGKVDVTLDDEALRTKLETGLNAVQAAKAGDARDIAVSVNGTGARAIAIDYVVPAPIWKATYRLTLPREGDKAEIQGWAVIENNSSDDWKNVRLSLSSGSPVTLHQRLHEAYYAQRPEVPVYGPNGIVPLADKGGTIPDTVGGLAVNQSWGAAQLSSALHQARPGFAVAAPAAPPQQDKNQAFRFSGAGTFDRQRDEERPNGFAGPIRFDYASALGKDLALQQESDTTSLFTLSTPVTLTRGQSLTLPFLAAKMSASRVSVFQPQLGIANPVAAVMVKNEGAASLPPGILTLTEDGSGYAGDAQLAGLPAGETRMVMFATDRKVAITTDTKGDQRLSRITYDNGALRAESAIQNNVAYKIKGAADADRIVIVEYPRRPGFTYASDQKDSETPTAIRLKVSVPKGGIAVTKLVEQRTIASSYTLADMENREPILAVWTQQAGANPKLLARIRDASDALAGLSNAKQVLSDFDSEVENIKSDQERIRENLRAVPVGSDLAKTYLANMTAQERRLAEIASLRIKGEQAVSAARKAFSEKLKAF